MRCPFCGAPDTRVVDSRLGGEGDSVRRRRECLECKERFTTYETVELSLPRVVKSDGSRQPFLEEKLRAGMARALEKRPVGADDLERAVSRIKKRLIAHPEREIASRTIGEWVMDELRGLDQVAYVRFASVYRKFQDLQDFRDEVERLQHTLSPEQRKQQLPLLPEER
ncbi:MAG: transcriptional regulator NrdR [Gammaproteobacteria bacterium]|nr:transcriptional regulator NrdR [Gammaproteobacteria bacterium]